MLQACPNRTIIQVDHSYPASMRCHSQSYTACACSAWPCSLSLLHCVFQADRISNSSTYSGASCACCAPKHGVVADLLRRHRNVSGCGPERVTKWRGRRYKRYNDCGGFGTIRVLAPRCVNEGPDEIPQETDGTAVSNAYGVSAACRGGDGGLRQRSLLDA